MKIYMLSESCLKILSLQAFFLWMKIEVQAIEQATPSHAHLISMYSPSEADFLSVVRMSLLFICNSICRILRIRIRCSPRESCQSAFRLRTAGWCLCRSRRSKGGCAFWLRQGTHS